MSLLYHAYVYLEFLILACTIYILAPSLILDSGECFVGDLEPIEYLAAYDQNDRLNYDWELIMHNAPKKIYYAHANEKIL